MELPVIRTLTLGIAEHHPLSPTAVAEAASRLVKARTTYQESGYEVQTVRITSRPVFDDMADNSEAITTYVNRLQQQLNDLEIDHFSLGSAQAARPDFPLHMLGIIEELVSDLPALSCTVQIASAEHGIRAAAAHPVACIMRRLAERTENGVGNFRFAALANVQPRHPFFPASYHAGPDALAVGLQGAGIVAGALLGATEIDPAGLTVKVREAVQPAAEPVVALAQQLAKRFGCEFGGIDLSPAPSVRCSIGEAISQCLPGGFGSPGTMAVISAITEALRTTDLPICGYNGVMLPVMEDVVLARAWEERRLTVHELLAYSAICGTGLDTVPLADNVTTEEIAGLLLDLASLACRLKKPLSARLFPLPGITPGDWTRFTSPHLINLKLPQ